LEYPRPRQRFLSKLENLTCMPGDSLPPRKELKNRIPQPVFVPLQASRPRSSAHPFRHTHDSTPSPPRWTARLPPSRLPAQTQTFPARVLTPSRSHSRSIRPWRTGLSVYFYSDRRRSLQLRPRTCECPFPFVRW
jgi:hypothetical protein